MEKPLSSAQAVLTDLLASVDIRVGGGRPWDLRVHDAQFFPRVLSEGTLGFGESYMDGWWDCDALDELCARAVHLEEHVSSDFRTAMAMFSALVFNLQSRRRSRVVGRRHYDLGNDFFAAMLDPAMQYSCAYFDGVDNLADAQRQKMDLICRKLGLERGMSLLDIGCGWGGLAKHAAEHYQCRVTGITISAEQQKFAASFCQGLPVEIRLQDYRDLSGSYDRVVSVGMIEHVGARNYGRYFETVHRCLKPNGLFLCQGIMGNRARAHTDSWITRYIFPNSMLPSPSQVARAAENRFILEDIHNFGSDYDKTLLAWERNFTASWHHFRDRYGDRFFRMWRYYLLSCAGAFRARSMQLCQFVFSRDGIPGGYRLARYPANPQP